MVWHGEGQHCVGSIFQLQVTGVQCRHLRTISHLGAVVHCSQLKPIGLLPKEVINAEQGV